MAACSSNASLPIISQAAKFSSAARATKKPWLMPSNAWDPGRSCSLRTSRTRSPSTIAWRRSTKSSNAMTSGMNTKKRYWKQTRGASTKSDPREKLMKRSSCLRLYRAGAKRRVLLLSVVLVVTAMPSATTAQTLSPILVAYAGQNETVGPMWVGIAKGTFKKYGHDVRMVQLRNGSLSMATLATGQVQYNYGSPANALSASAGGMRIQCAASPVHRIPRELIARKEIRTLEDLRGKTFGVQSIGGGFWLQTMIALDALGIDPEKYDLKMRVLGDTATVTQALGSGGVDATVIPYSFSEAAKRAGANVLADIGKLKIPYQGTTICFLRESSSNSTDTIFRLLKGLVDAVV